MLKDKFCNKSHREHAIENNLIKFIKAKNYAFVHLYGFVLTYDRWNGVRPGVQSHTKEMHNFCSFNILNKKSTIR